ncbi:MAG: carbamoyltransferase C-terminal domain-containing protein [Nanoarchaeota archaeon]|nr:carbamoyltransferase C-terminal domain-containing protein [Nanoarchaeota archaeon]
MYILGIHVGHNSTAALLKDGKIVGCVSEERFTRNKNESGFPFKSVEWLLKSNDINFQKIDLVCVVNDALKFRKKKFSDKFLDDYVNKSFSKNLKSKIGYKFPRLFEAYNDFKEKKRDEKQRNNSEDLKRKISKILKIDGEKIITLGHHLAHAYSPCLNLSRDEKTLIFTLDGEGSDGLCASVNIYDGSNMKTISKTKKIASLGYLYAITTIYLGMKPLEHEFKVMGIAPYSKSYSVDEIYPKFKNLLWVNNDLTFGSKFNMPFSDNFLKKEMRFSRFDNVSGAIQKLTEELTLEWISKATYKTGIHNISLSGGVFMNVKAAMRIAQLPEVEKIFVMPSAGDESNVIGACFYGYKIYCNEKNLVFDPKPIKDLYLGPEYDEFYIFEYIKKSNLEKRYKITKPKNINKKVSELLAKGEVVARCSGKSEWGARALGNRSILANPKNKDTIRIINEKIKGRDFWMPFTPSILDKDIERYIKNPKKIFAPYMAITFESKETAKEDLVAAIHPYDFTVRPQVVLEKWNPDYYEIIENFKKLTGIGGILNTSFNLHGEPNVLTPEDAIHTVDNSGINYLVLGNYLLEKKLK